MAPPSTQVKLHTGAMFDAIVEVKVGRGDKQKSFYLHNGILRYYSAYFEAALNRKFAEAKHACVHLREAEIETFENFVLWLYRGIYQDDASQDFGPTCRLWVFADRHQIPCLMNHMMNELRDKCLRLSKAPCSQVKYVYENTTTQSPLRRFMVDICARFGGPPSLLSDTNRESWPKDFLWDLLNAVWKAGNGTKADLTGFNMCKYHVHEDGVKCEDRSTSP